jgi:predicted ATP-grasp superfamily ATP-dependent carboligase
MFDWFVRSGARSTRTPAVSLGDLTLVRPLAMSGIDVVAVTTDPRDVVLRSRHVRAGQVVAGYSADRHLRTLNGLRELGSRLGGRAPLIYGTDAQLEFIYRHRDALEKSFRFVLNDDETAWALFDKERFARLCVERGVATPATVAPDGDAHLEIARLRGPLVVKPRRKSAWHQIQAAVFEGAAKARIFADHRTLLAHRGFARFASELLVQEFVTDRTEALASFHGFADERGRLLAAFCGRKIRTYPHVAGESSFIETVDDATLDATGREVVARLGLRGPFKIDFVYDDRTRGFLTLEVNARFNLWHYVGAARGVNIPAIAYRHLLGESVEPAAPRRGRARRWVHGYRDYQWFRSQRHARSAIGLGAWLRSIASPGTLYETFAWDDPLPFAHWVSRLAIASVR